MRCKNCGSENEDNLYICQNCGSPLYDEDDGENEVVYDDDMGKTRVAPAVQSNQRPASNQSPRNSKNENKNNNKAGRLSAEIQRQYLYGKSPRQRDRYSRSNL